jgi:hypothetical protein
VIDKTKLIYQYLHFAIDLCAKINSKVTNEGLTGGHFANDGHIVNDFLNFKAVGEVEGFNDQKKRMVVKSMLLMEKKINLVRKILKFLIVGFI